MFLLGLMAVIVSPRMLHARGDVSDYEVIITIEEGYAPRTWRCFLLSKPGLHRGHVCSTHVEMFQFLLSRFLRGQQCRESVVLVPSLQHLDGS